MEIIANTTEFYLNKETAVAIGKFDGIHMGHRRLLEEILEQKKNGLSACVFTFEPAPAVLFGLSDGKELTTREEKRYLFERMGIDILIEFPLTMETAGIAPEEFVTDILLKRMNTRFLAAGSDLSFGKYGAGDVSLLKRMGAEYDFGIKIIDKIMLEDIEVSSTYIRRLVENGKMQEAEAFLGMPYMVCGRVAHGNALGRTLGFPTVNLLPTEHKLLPPNGVYYSQVYWRGRKYKAISNVGYKPTVADEKVMGVESYLYDFRDEIYEEEIEVRLLAFKRPEQHFADVEALKEQLQKDITAGRLYGECKE